MMIWLALPGLLFFLIFSYIPMFGIVIAFKNFNVTQGILGSAWSGLSNFQFFFISGEAQRVLFNTVFLNVLFIAATTSCSVFIAILINEIRLQFYKRVVQSIILLPYFMSWVVIAMMVNVFIGGVAGQSPLLNEWFNAVHLPSIQWYYTPAIWPAFLTFLRVWQSAGYLSIIYLAAITSISEDIYEAAKIDGASSFRVAWDITLPLLLPTVGLLTVISVGRIFYGDFAMIYALVGDNGVLFSTTDVIDTFVFRALRSSGDLGMAAAVGLIQSIVGLVFVSVANRIARRYSPQSALF
jgi:putative aldouronate transport system permease protein